MSRDDKNGTFNELLSMYNELERLFKLSGRLIGEERRKVVMLQEALRKMRGGNTYCGVHHQFETMFQNGFNRDAHLSIEEANNLLGPVKDA